MLSIKRCMPFFILCVFISPVTYADGLADVKQALMQLQSTQDISATLSTHKKTIIDNDNITLSNVELNLQLNQHGFHISYSPQLLSTLTAEQQQKLQLEQARKNAKNKAENNARNNTRNNVEVENDLEINIESNAKNNDKATDEKPQWPTLTGMNKQSPIDLYEMLSGAKKLMHFIETVNFVEETPVKLNNQPMRKLTFDTPMHIIVHNKKTRRYVDDFEGKFHLWINQAGLPIQSELNFSGSGSFYLFFSASVKMENQQLFAIHNNRLVTTVNDLYQSTKHSFGSHEHTETTRLTVQ